MFEMLDTRSERRKFLLLALSFLFVLMAYETIAELYTGLELWQQLVALVIVVIVFLMIQKRRKR
jgi:uncharacterized membrane protein YagU involved in acid resistance